MALILALDFGGTKLTAATADTTVFSMVTPTWEAQQRAYSPAASSAQSDLAIMFALARELLAGEKATAVGVSFGGPVDYEAGAVRLSHHVAGWQDLPLRHYLETEFGAPACVDNDANVAALGEWRFGAGRGLADLLYITVSTGVGGGWILAGRPFRGRGGMAGEIGHTVVDPQGPHCLCGKRGCVERLASGPYMAADWAAQQPESVAVTGERLAKMAAQGEATAVQILQRGAWALGVGIGNAANLMDPQRVILGGGVTGAGAHWWEVVRRTARETALPQLQFDIVPAALGDDAPLWGAVALVEATLLAGNEDNS